MSSDTIARPRRRLPSATWYLLSLLLFSTYLAFHEPAVRNSEVFFSLRNGREVFETSSINYSDTFSWVSKERIWSQATVAHDVLMYAFDRFVIVDRFGMHPEKILRPGILFLQAFSVLLALIYFAQLLRENRFCDPARILGVVLFAVLSAPAWTVGSSMWNALFCVQLMRWIRFPRRVDILRLILLSLCWQLVNREFMTLQIVLGAVLVGALIDRDPKRAKIYGISFIATLVTLFVVPAGRMFVLNLPGFFCVKDQLLREMSQLGTPDFHKFPSLAIGLGTLAAVIPMKRSVFNWKLVLSILSGILLMLFSIRFAALFAVVVAFAIARVLHENLVGPSYAMIRFLKRFQAFRNSWRLHAAHACLIVLSLLALRHSHTGVPDRLEPLYYSIREWESEQRAQGRQLRLLNDYLLAGELIHSGFGVFADSRPELMSQQIESSALGTLVADYSALEFLTDDWKRVLDHWKFNAAVLYEDRPLTQLLLGREHWQIKAKTPPLMRNVKGRRIEYSVVFLVPPVETPQVVETTTSDQSPGAVPEPPPVTTEPIAPEAPPPPAPVAPDPAAPPSASP